MESVWDYPRPPALEPCTRRVRVVLGDVTIADSARALRLLETSHPPAIYVPRQDVAPGVLTAAGRPPSFCEWKGIATYLDVHGGGRTARAAAWTYPEPVARYADLAGHVSFYPGLMDACLLGDEVVRAQEGGFYGGWVTADIEGPFKGAPGTAGW